MILENNQRMFARQINYPAGTVTVNSATATLYGVQFEIAGLSVSTGSNEYEAVYNGPAFSNSVATSTTWIAVGDTTYTHDDNGNMTSDGHLTYQYNDNNRLTNVVNQSTTQSVFSAAYDGIGRRLEVTRNGTLTERYVYYPNSFLALAVLDETNGIRQVYTHGPDLSGTMGGAGGIGGILAEKTTAPEKTNYLHSDVMGNIVHVNDEQSDEVATYQYSPFGQLLNRTGEYQSRFLFSSKELDVEAGLYYYGYRYFSSALLRWLNRDPIEEDGGINLYAFVGNQSVNEVDYLGLYTLKDAEKSLKKNLHVREVAGGIFSPARYSKTQIFDEWYRLERTRGAWWISLPKCPKKLCMKNGKPQRVSDEWNDPEKPSRAEAALHPGAQWSMRSKSKSGHANQCTYTTWGSLIREPTASGTVDWQRPGFGSGHYKHDVAPAYLANELDSGTGANGGLTLILTTVTHGPIINSSPGFSYKMYLKVRPLWAEAQ